MIGIRQLPSFLRLSLLADGPVGLTTLGIGADHCTPGLALAGHGEALNELAFHFMLDLEHKRFNRSGQRYALLLIDLHGGSDDAPRIDDALSAQLFDALGCALRETDVIGWYRERHVAGALLTHLDEGTVADVCDRLSERIIRFLRDRLPASITANVIVQRLRPEEIVAS